MKLLKGLSLILPVLLCSHNVMAKEEKKPWVFTAGYGILADSDLEGKVEQDLLDLGHDQVRADQDLGSGGVFFEVGYKITDNWIASIGYVDFGDVSVSYDIDTTQSGDLINDVAGISPTIGDGFTYDVHYVMTFFDDLILKAGVGVITLNNEHTTQLLVGYEEETSAPIYLEKEDTSYEVEPYASFGVSYDLKPLEVGVKARYFDMDGMKNTWVGLNVSYHL